MKSITLEQFRKEYFPEVSKQKFAEIMHLSNSICSKILSGKYDCSAKSKEWNKICEYIKNNYNLQLISANKFDIASSTAERTIRNLMLEIKQLERIKAEQEQVIQELLSSIRIMSNAKESIEKGQFMLNKYKYKAKG